MATLERTDPIPDQSPADTITAAEASLPALLRHTWIQTQRLLLRWVRDPVTLLETLIVPCLLLLMLDIVVGSQIQKFSGHSALYGSTPMVTLVGALSGTVASGIMLGREREAGILARFWVLPVHRASGLAARILAEGCRIFCGTVVIIAFGMTLGFRFREGPLAAFAFLWIPVLFGLAFATMVTAIAVFTAKSTLVEAVALLSSLLMFFSTGFVPIGAYPNWIQPVVRGQPMSVAVDTMRALAEGGPLAAPLVKTVAWCVGLIVVFAFPAGYGYRRASRR